MNVELAFMLKTKTPCGEFLSSSFHPSIVSCPFVSFPIVVRSHERPLIEPTFEEDVQSSESLVTIGRPFVDDSHDSMEIELLRIIPIGSSLRRLTNFSLMPFASRFLRLRFPDRSLARTARATIAHSFDARARETSADGARAPLALAPPPEANASRDERATRQIARVFTPSSSFVSRRSSVSARERACVESGGAEA